MLAMERHEPVAQLTELARRGSAPVDPGRAAFAHLANEDDGIECRLHDGSLSAVANLVRRRPRAEREAERVNDQRLPASRFPGEQVEPGTETHGRFRDQGQVAHLELFEHDLFLRDQGSAPPKLLAEGLIEAFGRAEPDDLEPLRVRAAPDYIADLHLMSPTLAAHSLLSGASQHAEADVLAWSEHDGPHGERERAHRDQQEVFQRRLQDW